MVRNRASNDIVDKSPENWTPAHFFGKYKVEPLLEKKMGLEWYRGIFQYKKVHMFTT